jgi:hypothetical protein
MGFCPFAFSKNQKEKIKKNTKPHKKEKYVDVFFPTWQWIFLAKEKRHLHGKRKVREDKNTKNLFLG